MSFKTAMNKMKDFLTKKSDNDEQILGELVIGSEFVYSTATKSALKTLYVYIADRANIERVQQIYEKHGIKLQRHVSHLDNQETEVLYIGTQDFMNLSPDKQAFLTRTAPDDEHILRKMVKGSEFVYSTATKSALRTLYVYVMDGTDIERVQKIYAKHGIKLQRHVSHLDNKETEVLYIGTEDFIKLSQKQQDFLTRTAPMDGQPVKPAHFAKDPNVR